MPNNSAVIFLAGHGVVSIKSDVADDQLGSYHIILPAKLGRQFCLVAHNMISQNLMLSRTADEAYNKLRDLESIHGVSSVNISNRPPSNLIQFTSTSNPCDLFNEDHIQYLKNTIKKIKEFEGVAMDLFSATPDWGTLQSSFFKDVDFSQHDIRTEIKNRIEDSFRSISTISTDSVKAWKLREHVLSCLISEKDCNSIKAKLPDCLYTPQSPYDPHLVTDLDSMQLLGLTIYINAKKIGWQIATLRANEQYVYAQFAQHKAGEDINKLIAGYIHDGAKTNLQIEVGQAIYVTPSQPSHMKPAFSTFTLSQILYILPKIHILVSSNGADNPKVEFVCFADNPQHPYQYDFTIPNDANVVWGACRDISETDF